MGWQKVKLQGFLQGALIHLTLLVESVRLGTYRVIAGARRTGSLRSKLKNIMTKGESIRCLKISGLAILLLKRRENLGRGGTMSDLIYRDDNQEIEKRTLLAIRDATLTFIDSCLKYDDKLQEIEKKTLLAAREFIVRQPNTNPCVSCPIKKGSFISI